MMSSCESLAFCEELSIGCDCGTCVKPCKKNSFRIPHPFGHISKITSRLQLRIATKNFERGSPSTGTIIK